MPSPADATPAAEIVLRSRVAAIIGRLADPDVRALAALVASPSLVAPGGGGPPLLDDVWRWTCIAERESWLSALDTDPAPLAQHIAASNTRQLGRYAEALWHYWFTELPGAQVHAAGLPVRDGATVRGEFDFIVTLPGLPGVSHLETGYKFFLYCPPGADGSRLVGTDAHDRFDHKWRHMREVQLPLSQTALGRAALPATLAGVDITPRACLQGYVFYPLGTVVPALPWLAPGHARGWWCRSDTAADWLSLAPAWMLLDKRAWIAPARVPPGTATDDPLVCRTGDAVQAALAAHFASSRQPRLLSGLGPDGDGGWRESVRVFVMAPDWKGADRHAAAD